LLKFKTEVEGPFVWVGTGVSIWVEDDCILLQVHSGGRTGRLIPLESIVRLMEGMAGQDVYCSEGCELERVGKKGGEGCGMECEAEFKPRGTADQFRLITSGVMKSVSKK
jgi:hypothetical protein